MIDAATYGAIVIMVVVTTFITPPALKWSLARSAAPPTPRINANKLRVSEAAEEAAERTTR